MIVQYKADSQEIKDFLKVLKRKSWLGPAQQWWPDYLFRFDDIEAAASILNSGMLLSRSEALATGVLKKDCASPHIITSTSDEKKQFVRLYFRPRTPTQFDGEGFRAKKDYQLDAHFPVPIVMLFDSARILSLKETKFTMGNLASSEELGSDAKFLKQIPFEKVYHDTWFHQEERASIIYHRHAEVLSPTKINLDALVFIGCRTQAEYETLIQLLSPAAKKKFGANIGLGTKLNLHCSRWTFVETVNLNSKMIDFHFNPSSKSPGPFNIKVLIAEIATGIEYSWKVEEYVIPAKLTMDLANLKHPNEYVVRLFLDNNLAYQNRFSSTFPAQMGDLI